MGNFKWTRVEEEVLLKELRKKDAYLNLNKCFISVATKINRTPQAISQHYYTTTRKKEIIFGTVGKDGAIINTKITDNVSHPKIIKGIWRKVWKLFKL